MSTTLKLRVTEERETLLVQGCVVLKPTPAAFLRRGNTLLDRLEDLKTYNAALDDDDAEQRAELLERAWWTIREALYPA